MWHFNIYATYLDDLKANDAKLFILLRIKFIDCIIHAQHIESKPFLVSKYWVVLIATKYHADARKPHL